MINLIKNQKRLNAGKDWYIHRNGNNALKKEAFTATVSPRKTSREIRRRCWCCGRVCFELEFEGRSKGSRSNFSLAMADVDLEIWITSWSFASLLVGSYLAILLQQCYLLPSSFQLQERDKRLPLALALLSLLFLCPFILCVFIAKYICKVDTE